MKSIVRSICFVSSAGAVFLIAGLCASSGLAAVTSGGDTTIADTFHNTYVGRNGSGTLAIDGASSLNSFQGFIGDAATGTGTVTVSGVGSKWMQTSQGSLFIGRSGQGTLNIVAGGQVSTDSYSSVGESAGSIGTATISGPGSAWNTDYGLDIGSLGNGTMNITAGGEVSNDYGYVGKNMGSTGNVTVSGAGSIWENRYNLYVGGSGSGTLTVADGGMVTARSILTSLDSLYGNGTITATHGAVLDTDLLFDNTHGTAQAFTFGTSGTLNVTFDGGDIGVGYKGVGSMRIQDGMVINSQWCYLGMHAGSIGAATISGAGSTWVATHDLVIGSSGNGTLHIEAGGSVVQGGNGSYATSLARDPGSTGAIVVQGAGSKWTNNGGLGLGRQGDGRLTVTDGGQVVTEDASIGTTTEGRGTVTINGLGSTWTGKSINIGSAGLGTLLIEAGGQVSTVSANVGGGNVSNPTGIGVVSLTGPESKWIDSNTIRIGYRNNGTLTVASGGQVNGKNGIIGDAAGSIGDATARGADSKWTNSGSLKIGNLGTGTLTVADGGQVTAQSLSINAASTVRLHVSDDNMLVLGSAPTIGTLTNNGTVGMYADAFLPAGVYPPLPNTLDGL